MKLFSGPLCLYGHVCRFVMQEKDAESEFFFLNDQDAENELAELNPYVESPTLVDRDLVLYSTVVINEFLDERLPHPPLMPIDPVGRGRARLLISRLQRDLTDSTVLRNIGTIFGHWEIAYHNLITGLNKIEMTKKIGEDKVYELRRSWDKRPDPLSKDKHIDKNRVKRCQFDLFVDWEKGKFKAWSNAMIAGGYAYVLLDIFNSSPIHEAKKITVDHFKNIKMDELLTMNRKTGFYEMIEMMIERIKNVKN